MIKFGPSGNSELYHASGFEGSSNSAKWVKNMGLDCFEYSFGRGVNLSTEKAIEIGKSFASEGVEISVHCPYFINFANPDEEKISNSFGYVLSSLKACKLMGGKRAVFHPATQGKMGREEAVSLAAKNLERLARLIEDNGYSDIKVCPETMGKSAQIGTTYEIANFCNIAPFFYPCLDFGHINSLEQGSLKTEGDFLKLFDIVESVCGYDKLDNMHVHFSKIMYGPKGEIKHLTFADTEFGPMPEPFVNAVKLRGINPYVISESAGTQDIDAKTLKTLYENA